MQNGKGCRLTAPTIRMTSKKAVKRETAVVLLSLFCCCFGIAAETQWTLAAQKFRFRTTGSLAPFEEAESSLLPQLILENISQGLYRTPLPDEILNRKLDTLKTERTSLFLQLSGEIQKRDAIVFEESSAESFKKAVAAQNKKIQDIQVKINENVATAEKLSQEYSSDGAPATGAPDARQIPFFGPAGKKDEQKPLAVVLYNDSYTALYEPPAAVSQHEYGGFEFANDIRSKKIDGLITGIIKNYGDYAAVTVTLRLYPGALEAGTVTEIGLLSDTAALAKNIVYSLVPLLSNSLPVTLQFDIQPPEALPGLRLMLDDRAFNSVPDHVVVPSGIHTVSFESDGYDLQRITYNFSGGGRFFVSVLLQKTTEKDLVLFFPDVMGAVYPDGVYTGETGTEKHGISVRVNGKPVIGEFRDAENKSAFFYIPSNLQRTGAQLSVSVDTYDRAADIEKHRRKMYLAYSILISSLPASFYAYGNFNSKVNAYNDGREDYDEVLKWQTYSRTAVGFSVAAGIWFSYELIRYLFSVDQVLPETVKKNKG
jgi:hypothetical protein